jgi:hypothetical protein
MLHIYGIWAPVQSLPLPVVVMMFTGLTLQMIQTLLQLLNHKNRR